MSQYYFDTLPVHPQPKPLESFTGYLTRLAQANGMHSISQLSRLCFPDGSQKFTINAGDHPPRSFGALATAAACPESELLRTTFYHLGRKFGRLTTPHHMSHFLSGSVFPGLRYCPHCLTDQGYYALIWRFLEVEGCFEHNCRLLDCCGHCGEKIPLLTSPLKLGFCPVCGGDLRDCQVEPLNEQDRQNVQAWTRDFTFLTTPHPAEEPDRQMLKHMGQQFTRWRQLRRLKICDGAEYIGQEPSIIYVIENPPDYRGVKFQWYLQYADFLKVRFLTMFETPLPPSVQTKEDKLFSKVQQAIMSLEEQDVQPTQQAICQMLCISFHTLSKYPQVRALWLAGQEKWHRRHEAELVRQIHQTAETLATTGERVTQEAICRQMGWSAVVLREYHPQARIALKQAVEEMRERREEILLDKVKSALSRLEDSEQKVTKKAIGQIVGLSVKCLQKFPKVRTFLQEQVMERQWEHHAKHFQQREQELVLLTRQAIEDLTAAGQAVTRKAICERLGRARSGLESYPRVELLLKEVVLTEARRQT